MRIIVSLFLTFAVTTLFCQETRVISNDNFNISIQTPKEWYCLINETRISIKGPIPENIGINYTGTAAASLEVMLESVKSSLKGKDGFKIISESIEIINNQEYYHLEYEMNRGFLFHDHLYLTINNGDLYSITITSTKDRHKANFDLLYSIFKSLKFLD